MSIPADVIDSFRGPYRWLSNFELCPVAFEGQIYRSSEHAYQAAKAPRGARADFLDPDLTCGGAKRLGRRMLAPLGWDEDRLWVMQTCVMDKFVRNTDLGHRLIATGDAPLIEGNTWNDTFWGVCNGQGANNLGIILMRVRTWLQSLADP